MAFESNQKLIIGILALLILFAINSNVGFFSVFDDASYVYEQEVSFLEFNGVAKSATLFGVDTRTTSRPNCDDTVDSVTTTNKLDGFSIEVGSSSGTSKSGCGGPAWDSVSSYVLTTDLMFNIDTVEKLEISFDQDSSASCSSPGNQGVAGNADIYLVDPGVSEILLHSTKIHSTTQTNSHDSGKIVLFENLGVWVIDILGERETIELTNNTYELGIVVKTPGGGGTCGGPGSGSVDFDLIDLKLIKKPIPVSYYRFENNFCSMVMLTPSEVTINDYSELADCTSKIINPEKKHSYYRLEGDECTMIELYSNETTNIDYLSEEQCNSAISSDEDSDDQAFCTADALQCADGTFVSRNPDNDCEFYECPKPSSNIPTIAGISLVSLLLLGIVLFIILRKGGNR